MKKKISDKTHYRFDVAVEMTISNMPYSVLITDQLTGFTRGKIVDSSKFYNSSPVRKWRCTIFNPVNGMAIGKNASYNTIERAIGRTLQRVIETTPFEDFSKVLELTSNPDS